MKSGEDTCFVDVELIVEVIDLVMITKLPQVASFSEHHECKKVIADFLGFG
jgi:hypothetical protein